MSSNQFITNQFKQTQDLATLRGAQIAAQKGKLNVEEKEHPTRTKVVTALAFVGAGVLLVLISVLMNL